MQLTLYISHSKRGGKFYYLDASARYRCIFPCEAHFEANSHHCIHITDVDSIDLSKYQTVIFHRPSYNKKLVSILDRLGRLNITAKADYDDLLFSPEHAFENPTYLSGQMSKRTTLKQTKLYLRALQLFNFVQVSTDCLKEYVKNIHPSCHIEVTYNRITDRWITPTSQASIEERFHNKVIRYFPGTMHHTANFSSWITFLQTLLSKDKDIKLEVVGDISIPQHAFNDAQLERKPFVLFEDLPDLIQSSWITISPLDQNSFNQCKSGLKFWESGVFGVPTISNTNPDMARFSNQGLCLSNDSATRHAFIEQMKDKAKYEITCKSVLDAAQDSILQSQLVHSHINHKRDIHKALCVEFTPSWPAIALNPTHFKHNQVCEKLQHYKHHTCSPNDICNDEYQKAFLEFGTINSAIKRRKLRKLIRNPKLFFKDLIRNQLVRL